MSIATRHAVRAGALSLGLALVVGITSTHLDAQNARPPQRLDTVYTAKIKELLQDPRITTELVDHLPASDSVPTPLDFHGRIVGQPGEITYAKDIHRYYEAIDKASDRALVWSLGKSEEGRDMVLLAIADEATIKQLSKYQGHARAADRSQENDRCAGAATLEDGEANLLHHQWHALPRNRWA